MDKKSETGEGAIGGQETPTESMLMSSQRYASLDATRGNQGLEIDSLGVRLNALVEVVASMKSEIGMLSQRIDALTLTSEANMVPSWISSFEEQKRAHKDLKQRVAAIEQRLSG